jgi:hypothetical protein
MSDILSGTVTGLVDSTAIQSLNLSQIGDLIRKTWVNKEGKSNVNFAAVPYLQAMESLDSVNDKYGFDDGKSIVLYFLSNASQYKGEQAKIVKAELKRRIK